MPRSVGGCGGHCEPQHCYSPCGDDRVGVGIDINVFVGVFNSQMEFVANSQGEVTHMILHGVEGDVQGERKPNR